MINYKLLKQNKIIPKKISKLNSSYLVETDSNKYILKNRDKGLDKKFDYLLSRGFNYFPKHTSIGDYDVFNYIKDLDASKEEKLEELVNLTSLLHTKTTRYESVDLDDYKEIYEELAQKIEYLNNYYLELNDLIDNEIYMSPSHYLLAYNISKIYSALSFCREELDNWYELIKNSSKQRVALVHNNLDISHILRNTSPYLISWSYSKTSNPIDDLLTLYDKYSSNNNFDNLFDIYQKRYPLREEELKLFFIKISIPDKPEFSLDELENIRIVKRLFLKLYCGDKLIRPYYEKKKKLKN